LTSAENGATYQWIDCNNNNIPIAGATNQSYTATDNGSYAVIVTVSGCTDTSSCHSIVTSGLPENTFGSEFTVFPNPTSDQLTVDLGATLSNVIIKVSNLKGQLISTTLYEKAELITFDIEGAPGVYMVDIQTENGDIKTFKVLKK